MKTLNIILEDDDFEALTIKKEKQGLTWREFILTLLKEDEIND
jgi:predicted DNA binding CopG/RHH family protein